MEKQSLSDFYGVNPSDYKEISADVLDLPVRISNRFHRYKIETIEDLLLISWEDIDGWYGFGKGCKDTLDLALGKLFSGSERPALTKSGILPPYFSEAYVNFQPIELNGLSLSRSQRSLVDNYNNAVTTLEKSDVDTMISNPEYCIAIIESLNNAATQLRAKVIAEDLIRYIPEKIRRMPVQEALELYSDNYSFVYKLINEDENESFEDTLFNKCEEWIQTKSFELLCSWIKMNLSSAADELFSGEKFTEKMIDILNERSKGNTLEQVGKKFGVTRERIRQIESKCIRFISAWDSKKRISRIIRFRYIGKGYISTDEFIDIFGNYGSAIYHYFKSVDGKYIRYERDYNGFSVCDENVLREMQRYVDGLPDVIHISDSEILDEEHYPSELLHRELMSQYKLTGDVYHRSRLTLTSVYSDILKNDFPKGIHVYDDKELNEFRKKIEERYGEIKTSTTNRAMGVRIADVGILCGRGIYKSKQVQYITDELAERILDYIEKGDSPAYLTNTIFAVFEKELVEQGIDNKYYLQGIIREIYGNKFWFRRDYIIKDANFTNISSALIDFISKSNTPVSKREIYEKFPGITDIVINLTMTDNRIINLFGTYIATKHIDLDEEEVDYLKEVTDEYTQNGKSVHCKEIYYEVCNTNKIMLTRNFIVQPFGIFDLLEHLFPDDYNFDRPYIARKDVEIEKTIDSLYAKVSESDVVDLDEISAIAKERHFQINSQIIFANACNDTHLLISNHQLASMDYLDIDEQVATNVENIILSNISSTIPINKLTCIHLFPRISTQWNEWVIYSLVNKFSDRLEVSLSSNQIRLATPFISKKGEFDNDIMNSFASGIQNGITIADDMNNIDELIEGIIDDEILF